MKYIFLFLFYTFCFGSFAQQINISFKGVVKIDTSNNRLFGSTLYLIQNGSVVGKTVTDRDGSFVINGDIIPSDEFELVSSKPGFASKKILINMDEYKSRGKRNVELILQFSNKDSKMYRFGELEFSLFKKVDNVNLDFTKNEYAEKFIWNEQNKLLVAEGKMKDMDERIKDEINNQKSLNSLNNSSSNLDSNQIAQNEANLLLKIQQSIQKAKSLSQNKKFDDAINEYRNAEKLISTSTKPQTLTNLTSQVSSGLQDAKSKKDTEELAFNDQLKLAKKNVLNGDTALVMNILSSEPMKSKASHPEVLAIKKQLKQLQRFYQSKMTALNTVQTDTIQGVKLLNEAYQIGINNSSLIPAKDISEIKNELDKFSLSNSSSNNSVNKINKPPGSLTNKKNADLMKELDETKLENDNAEQKAIQKKKDEIQNEISMADKLNSSYIEENRRELENWNSKKANSEEEIKRQEKNRLNEYSKIVDTLNYNIFYRDSLNNSEIMNSASKIQRLKLDMDSINYSNKLYNDSLNNLASEKIEEFKFKNSIIELNLDSLSIERQKNVESNVFNIESEIYQRDLMNENDMKVTSSKLENLKLSHNKVVLEQLKLMDSLQSIHRGNIENFKTKISLENKKNEFLDMERTSNIDSVKFDLNNTIVQRNEEQQNQININRMALDSILITKTKYYREPNEIGKGYPKSKVTEEKYVVENSDGFTELVTIRRIVVDEFGFGVYYDHKIESSGKSSFSRNGIPITEHQWFNESNVVPTYD